jgi:hypothetical protein
MKPATRPSAAMLAFLYGDLTWSTADIGFLFGLDRTTVTRYLHAADVAMRPREPYPRRQPEPKLGRYFFIELAEQTEMGWSPQQARMAFVAAVRGSAQRAEAR